MLTVVSCVMEALNDFSRPSRGVYASGRAHKTDPISWDRFRGTNDGIIN